MCERNYGTNNGGQRPKLQNLP